MSEWGGFEAPFVPEPESEAVVSDYDVPDILTPEDIRRRSRTRYSAYVYAGGGQETSDYRVEMATGPAWRGRVPAGVRYPIGMTFLGHLEGVLSIVGSRQTTEERLGPSATMPNSTPTVTEEVTVSMSLAETVDPVISRFNPILDGVWYEMASGGGGAADDDSRYYRLVIVCVNQIRELEVSRIYRPYLKCWHFFRGKATPARVEIGGAALPVDPARQFEFKALADSSPLNRACPRPRGIQCYYEWTEDGVTGEYCSPRWPEYGG